MLIKGINYPWDTEANIRAQYTISAADFKLLDTNNNGKLDYNDDPYLPFWPGEDYVDWVGLSLYWYPSPSLSSEGNLAPPENYYTGALFGTSDFCNRFGRGRVSNESLNFYNSYAKKFNKPMMAAYLTFFLQRI
jgi:hypothetical protein